MESNVGQKVQTSDISRFYRNFNFSKILQTVFFSSWLLPNVKIAAKSSRIWPKNPPEKGNFIAAEMIQKNLKIYKLLTTNAILIKPTMIMYGKNFVQIGLHLEE